MILRSNAWLRMFSNQIPADSVFTSSWRDNSMRCARVMSSHIGVP